MNHRVLLVEDSPANVAVYQSYLESNFDVDVALNGKDALMLYRNKEFDVLLLDIQLPDMSGIDILKSIRMENVDIPIVMITAHGSVDVALEAIHCGANDFLSKPFDKARIEVTLSKILKEKKLTDIVEKYEKSCTRKGLHTMIGESLPLQSVYNIIESSATSKATVFITGESGTGKELCAEAIHEFSQRKNKPFVALNCAAIPRDLLESEIFGHVKGAFTGASSSRQGAASRAHEGTLFLDEIGEMPLDLQSKLLRFIQTGTFQAVGGSKENIVDIRFICATNRDPLEEVRCGRFREDLYYRLHVIPIHMPPLRERGKDCLLIAKSILTSCNQDENKSFLGFDPSVEKIFLNYKWPGNIRELGNIIRNTVVLNNGSWVTPAMLPRPINDLDNNAGVGHSQSLISNDRTLPNDRFETSNYHVGASVENSRSNDRVKSDTLEEPSSQNQETLMKSYQEANVIEPLWISEKQIIERAITICNGNIPKAAAFLEISASTIYRKKQGWDSK